MSLKAIQTIPLNLYLFAFSLSRLVHVYKYFTPQFFVTQEITMIGNREDAQKRFSLKSTRKIELFNMCGIYHIRFSTKSMYPHMGNT